MPRTVNVVNLGLKDYQQSYKIQKEFVKKRQEGKITDTLIFVEHPPVFTIGRNGSRKNILASSERLKKEKIKIYEIDRGGDITYHGPGQIVGYPIIDLRKYGKDIHIYLRTLEEILIKMLEHFSISAERIKGMTGVWINPVRNNPHFLLSQESSGDDSGISNGVNDKKIASIGIGISKWITYHGFSLNIDPNMKHFEMINPCGLGKPITSMKEQLNSKCPKRGEIEEKLTEIFTEVFQKRKIV
jgi:lipoate-protein ligase B